MSRRFLSVAFAPLLWLTAATLFTGCHTERLASSPDPIVVVPGKVDLAGLAPGIILITSGSNATDVSADPPNGRVEPASEGAADATRSFLNTPNLGNPQLEAGVGVVQFALAPFAAAYGAISASQRKLSPGELSEAQQALVQTMKTNAAPGPLVQKVTDTARQKTRRLLVCDTGGSNAPPSQAPVSAVLEVAVNQFRLKVRKPGGDQYVLSIGASARLTRVSDGRVLLERKYHYESGPDLFIDWTRPGGLEAVAETGYQELASQIAEDIFQPGSQPPILIGPEKIQSRATLIRVFSTRSAFALHFVSLVQEEVGSMEVHTGRFDDRLGSPKPAPEIGSSSGDMSDTKWSMDGLEEDRNAVVQGLSCLAAVPLGLWEQTVGVFHKHSRERKEAYTKVLNTASTHQHFETDLADEVTRRLRAKSADSVRRTEEPMRFSFAASPSLTETPRPGAVVASKTALEIQVLSTRLVGKHSNSSSRAVVVEIQATVFRTSDGQELYSRPIRYRSAEKRLKDWAASDARLFRQELATCSRRTAQALVSDLLTRGLVTPRQNPNSGVPDQLH